MLFQLVETPIGHYLYDAGINSVVSVSSDAYVFLSEVLSHKSDLNDIPVHLSEEINGIVQEDFLRQHQIVDVQHPLTEYSPDILQRFLSAMTLQITQDCNLRCSYCPYTHNIGTQRTHSSRSMDFNTAKKALFYLKKHSVDANQSIGIGFYGGEPLLEFNLIKEIVDEAERMFSGKLITYNITTNFSLITDEIATFLLDHNFNILVSLDGTKDVNDKNRKFNGSSHSVYDTVVEKLKSLSHTHPGLLAKLSISMVMDPSCDFDSFASLPTELPNILHNNIRSTIIDDRDLQVKNDFSPDYLNGEAYHAFLFYLSKLNRFPQDSGQNILYFGLDAEWAQLERSFKKAFVTDVISPSGPCLPGHQKVFVDVDGSFYPCEKVSELPVMYIGDVNSGLDKEKAISLLNVAQLTKDECMRCWAFRLCSSCILCAQGKNSLSATNRLDYCQQAKSRAHMTIRNYLLARDMYSHNLNRGED